MVALSARKPLPVLVMELLAMLIVEPMRALAPKPAAVIVPFWKESVAAAFVRRPFPLVLTVTPFAVSLPFVRLATSASSPLPLSAATEPPVILILSLLASALIAFEPFAVAAMLVR